MRCRLAGVLIVVVAHAVAAEPAPAVPPWLATQPGLVSIRDRLVSEFAERARDLPAYRRRVRRECRGFPEGDLFPYLYPAVAFANLAQIDPAWRQLAPELMAPLVDEAIAATARQVRAPGRDLTRLQHYRDQATYLGHLAFLLGAWRAAGGDDRYEATHQHLCRVLALALHDRRDGRPLWSFPKLMWPFDTVPVITALAVREAQTGEDYGATVAWANFQRWQAGALDPATGLPMSRLDRRLQPDAPPRGCEISLRLAMLPLFDRPAARELYQTYTTHAWRDVGVAAGFSEWIGPQQAADPDSGPIVWEIGTAATGIGLAAVIAADDQPRLTRLADQLVARDTWLAVLRLGDPDRLGGMIPYRDDCYTGFLFGDAILVYALTWAPWGQAAP